MSVYVLEIGEEVGGGKRQQTTVNRQQTEE